MSPAFLLRSQAISKGVFGGQRGWQILAVLIFGRRLMKQAFGRQPEVLVNETLRPGESMTIRTMKPPPTGRRARRDTS